MPPHLVYSPTSLSPSITYLTIQGPTYLIRPSTLPTSVTHLVFTDDAPSLVAPIKALMALPSLTHVAFKFTQQALPFAPDPSERVRDLLDSLYAKGHPHSPLSHQAQAGMDAETPTAGTTASSLSLIVILLSANVDTRIVETLANYRRPVDSESENDLPRLVVLKEGQEGNGVEWWSSAEWAAKDGDAAFWNRMEGVRSIFQS